MPVSMPTYPAKFVDLKTVLLFFLKSRLTTRGFSFSLMVHDLFFTSQLHTDTFLQRAEPTLGYHMKKERHFHALTPEIIQNLSFWHERGCLWMWEKWKFRIFYSTFLKKTHMQLHLCCPLQQLMCTLWTPRRKYWTTQLHLKCKQLHTKLQFGVRGTFTNFLDNFYCNLLSYFTKRNPWNISNSFDFLIKRAW